MTRTLGIIAALALVGAAACEEPPSRGAAAGRAVADKDKPEKRPAEREDEPHPAGGASAPGPATPQARPVEPPKPPPEAPKLAKALFQVIAEEQALQRGVAEEARKDLSLKAAKLRHFRRMIVEAYSAREYKPFTSKGLELTEDGRLAAELVADVESHGLEPSPYPVERVRNALQIYDAARARLERAKQLPKAKDEMFRKLSAIAASFQQGAEESDLVCAARLERTLIERGFSDEQSWTEAVAELRKWKAELRTASKVIQEALHQIDVAVLQGFFQYALDFKYYKVAHPFRAIAPDKRPRASRRYRKDLVRDLEVAGDELGRFMRGLWPTHPYYEKARKALARYRKLAEEGVPRWKHKRKLRKGSKGKLVVALRKRLAAEGYYQGDDLDNPVFDDALDAAVKHFQRTHQLTEDGVVQDTWKGGLAGLTRRSLNVPMSDRVNQLRLSLQRWRESSVGQHDYYLRVNIPQFEVEVWEKDQLLRAHRIIVGNNKFEVDEEGGRKGHLNRTALIDDELEMVVINPVWHVPERIRSAELLVEAEKYAEKHGSADGYWAKHNYKVETRDDGTQKISQQPGKGNALGEVKLLFPNRHSIYMHDTPKKRLFKKVIRAYSHGCMRLKDPVAMAKFLLDKDGRMDGETFDRILARRKERGVKLETKVPIHIEYNTVAFRPDSDDPIFLNDVYKYDRAYWRGEVPLKRHVKIPKKVKEPEEEDDPNAVLPGEEGAKPAAKTAPPAGDAGKEDQPRPTVRDPRKSEEDEDAEPTDERPVKVKSKKKLLLPDAREALDD